MQTIMTLIRIDRRAPAAACLLLGVALMAGGQARAQEGFGENALKCYQQSARGDDAAAESCARAAEAGDGHAAFLLALAETDAERRVGWLQRAVGLGHARAAAVLAEVRRREGDNQRANELELAAARGGFGPSRIRLAQALRRDRDNAQSLARARNILLAAAAAGYPDAQYLVAGMLKSGEGGDVDDAGAAAWMLEAASSGHVQAQFELGVVRGQQNAAAGIRWLTKAARAGHVGAMVQLARLLNESRGDRGGKQLARYWANRAVLFGHPQAPALFAAIGDPAQAPVAAGPNLIARVQQALTDLGYDPGPVDGLRGGRTRSAIEAFQQSRQLTVTGEITGELLAQLQQAVRSR